MGDIHDDLREVMAISLDRDLDVLPPWPSLPEPWTTASVTYAEDGETCTQRVWTEKQLRAFGKACAQMALNEAAKHGPALLARQEGEDRATAGHPVAAERAESVCVHCFSPPHMWGMICCKDYWNDPRTELLTETQANARRAARSGGGG